MKLNEILLTSPQTTPDREYLEFCEFVYTYSNGQRIDELSLPPALKQKINFVVDLAKVAKYKIKDLLKLFTDKYIFGLFSKIGWDISKFFDAIRQGYNTYKKFQDIIKDFVKSQPAFKWTKEKVIELDDYLMKKNPALGKLIGFGMGCLLLFIWFNMSFTGNPLSDFDLSDVVDAFAGKFALSKLLTSEGAMLASLFAIGLAGLSFPWPGPTHVKFIIAVITTLAKKSKVVISKAMENDTVIQKELSSVGVKI